jgi:hypothetical protein
MTAPKVFPVFSTILALTIFIKLIDLLAIEVAGPYR